MNVIEKHDNFSPQIENDFSLAENATFAVMRGLFSNDLIPEWAFCEDYEKEQALKECIEAVSKFLPPKTENDALLTPQYLLSLGFVKDENGFYSEPHVKERDRIWINFTGEYYRVWHGSAKIFINLKNKQAWFDAYYKLMRD